MKARFELHRGREVVLVVQPDDDAEAMLMEVFLRRDVDAFANVFRVLVERSVTGRVREVILSGERG